MVTILADNEKERIAALRRYSVLDTPPERAYDDIVQLAKFVCDVPIALISLVDENRQWFKAKIGLDVCETARNISFCTHALENPGKAFIVSDAMQDERFANNPLVCSAPHIRFYAGIPLVDSDSMVLGTLCVIDHVPRVLSADQLSSLHSLASQIITRIEMAYRVRQLEDSEIRFLKFMDCSPAIAFVKDEKGRYIYVNETFLTRFGLEMKDVLGKDDFQLMPYAAARTTRAHDLKVLTSQQTVSLVEAIAENDSDPTSYWQVHKFPLHGQGLIGGVATDITALKHYEKKLVASQAALEASKRELQESLARLEILSTTDALTGLKNRRAINADLENEWAYAARYGTPLSVLMMDLDHFKRVNDTLGHQGGDELLKAVAEILTRHNRTNDSAARFGGEEFIAVLPNTDERGARNLAERIRLEVESIGVTTISIGVAARGALMNTPEDLVKAADNALYRAKRKGRNRVSLSEARSSQKAGERRV